MHDSHAVPTGPANLGSPPEPSTSLPQHDAQNAAEDGAQSALNKQSQPKQKAAYLATSVAVVTAIMGSACCWLPLLLIALGFSAAGVSGFFNQYRPFLLAITVGLLGVAWYFTYRRTVQRAWSGIGRRLAPVRAGDACCEAEVREFVVDSCCTIKPAKPAARGEECCGLPARSVAGQPIRRWFTTRQLNQAVLWVATVFILLVALFPHWMGMLLGGKDGAAGLERADHQRIVLDIQGMTCETCAVTVQMALRGVPGVTAAHVSYEQKQALVYGPSGQEVPRDALLTAVRQVGYDARLIEPSGNNEVVYRLTAKGMSCEGCAAAVRKALRRVPGVVEIEVDYNRSEVTVKALPGSGVKPERLIEAVQSAGFTAALKN